MNIKTDVMGTKIHNIQRISSKNIKETMNRLSTGLRINSAKDDAAGLAISERLTARENALKVGAKNIQDSASLLKTAEGSISIIQDMVQRIRELTLQAKNGTNSTTDINTIQKEINSVIQGIDKIATSTTFNKIPLLTKGGGISFDGLNSEVKLQHPLNNPPNWTMEFWFKANDLPSFADGMVGEQNNPRVTWGGSSSGDRSPIVQFLAGYNTLSSGSLEIGKWYHVAATAENATSSNPKLSLYVDGELQQQIIAPTSSFPFESMLYLGRRDNTTYFNGEIDDVRVWEEARTQDEIRNNMGKTFTESENNLAGYWRFDEGSGDETENLMGSTINGELLNGASFNSLKIKTGDRNEDEMFYSIENMESVRLGLKNFDVTNPEALNILNGTLDFISTERSKIGSKLNRLDFNLDVNHTEIIQTEKTISSLSNADFAKETSILVKEQIKVQSSIQMLAKNNSNRELAINLLNG